MSRTSTRFGLMASSELADENLESAVYLRIGFTAYKTA